ncbi:hypothetical protein Tco_0001863 [Tanacetum coccineum]
MLHSKELASPKQMALALAIPEQTATGKEISNPFMAGSLPKTSRPTVLGGNSVLLGKFDGKDDEGFFVGYSVVDSKWTDCFLNVDSCDKSMNYVPVVVKNQTMICSNYRDNIVTGPKDSKEDAGVKPTKFDEMAAGPSFTNDDPSSPVNAARTSKEHLFEQFSPFKNAITLRDVPNVFSIDDTGIFGNAYDDEDVGVEADLNNLETTMNVIEEKQNPRDTELLILPIYSSIKLESKKVIQALEDSKQDRSQCKRASTIYNINFRRFEHWLIYLMARGPLEQNGSLETKRMKDG